MDRVWPNVAVGDSALQVHTSAICKGLGANRALLKTISGRGYRLLGNWTVQLQDASLQPVGLQRIPGSERTPGTNLPVVVAPLVGRSAAMRRIQDLLSANRAVTLTGPGGIGKTALALKVARRILGEFEDGEWLVELASLTDPDLVPC